MSTAIDPGRALLTAMFVALLFGTATVGCAGDQDERLGFAVMEPKVQMLLDGPDGQPVCAATWVNDTTLVTAAHCASSERHELWVGAVQLAVWPVGMLDPSRHPPGDDLALLTTSTVSPVQPFIDRVHAVSGDDLRLGGPDGLWLDTTEVGCGDHVDGTAICVGVETGQVSMLMSGSPLMDGDAIIGVVSSATNDGVVVVTPLESVSLLD